MERCGFFDAYLNGEEYDRAYLANSFAAYFASFINNGVFAERADQLQVMSMATPSMQITVRKGQGWINGYWYENTDELYLPIDVADGVLHRIDSIVLRWGSSERTMWLAVKKGTAAIANPQPPTLTRNADYYELQLALVNIPASSISITQAQITDTRLDTNVCGWVTGVVDQIDTTTLFAQFEAYFQEFQQFYENEYATWSAAQRSAYLTWFAAVQDALGEDTAGNLLNLVNRYKAKQTTVTLLSTGWTASGDVYTQTLSVSIVPANCTLHSSPVWADREAYGDAEIGVSAASTDSVTFTAASEPDVDLDVYISVSEVDA